jgi:hypothetical protein
VFSINPKQLDRFRDRHTAAGAKDDSRDAYVAAVAARAPAATRKGPAEALVGCARRRGFHNASRWRLRRQSVAPRLLASRER